MKDLFPKDHPGERTGPAIEGHTHAIGMFWALDAYGRTVNTGNTAGQAMAYARRSHAHNGGPGPVVVTDGAGLVVLEAIQ